MMHGAGGQDLFSGLVFRRERIYWYEQSPSRINTTQYPSYRLHKPQVASEGARAGAAGGPSAPPLVGRAKVRAESVEMGAVCGLPGVTLVDARGADHCEPAHGTFKWKWKGKD